MIILKRNLYIVLLSVLFFNCTASKFDNRSLEKAQSLKLEALSLMSKANESYSLHEGEISNFKTNMNTALAYEKKRSDNEETIKLYERIINPNGQLIGGFLNRWKISSTLRPEFIQEFKIQISEAFDKIIDLESSKSK